jgi:hypothetical protein
MLFVLRMVLCILGCIKKVVLMGNSLCKPAIFAGLIGGALLMGCNGRSQIEATIGAFNLGDAKFVFYGKAEGGGLDFTNNDINDTIANVTIIFTDKRSLCRDMENLSIIDDLSKLGTAQLMVFNAELRGIDTDESPLTGDVVIADGDNIDVNIDYVSFVDEQNQAQAANPTGDVSVTVKRLNPEWLAGTLTATLNDGAADIVLNGDFSANRCFAIDNLALTGGL